MMKSLMCDQNMKHHVERILSPLEIKNHIDKARAERSKAFVGMVGSVNSGVRKFMSKNWH
jgi:hypothetical protein